MSKSRAGIRIDYVDGRDDPVGLAEYHSLISKTVASEAGKNIFWPSHEELLRRNTSLVLARVKKAGHPKGKVVAGIHVVIDALPSIHLQGAVTDPSFRLNGAMRLCVEEAIIGATDRQGAFMPIICDVRMYPDGTMNEPARKLFTSYKMRRGGVIGVKIMDQHFDLHLRGSQEFGGHFRALKLIGGGQETYREAQRRRYERLAAATDIACTIVPGPALPLAHLPSGLGVP